MWEHSPKAILQILSIEMDLAKSALIKGKGAEIFSYSNSA
jgi:hypothetical protein